MFFSKSTGGFYSEEIHGGNIPLDAVEISDQQHQALMDGQVNGKRIVPDASGFPMLADPATLTQAQVIEEVITKARQMRLPVLSILDGLQASALATAATMPVGDPPVATPLAQVIEDLKQGLRDLPNTVDLSACTTREEMEEVVLAAYYALAGSAPAQVQSAFNSLVV